MSDNAVTIVATTTRGCTLRGCAHTAFERTALSEDFEMKTITKIAVGIVLFASAFAVYAANGCCPCC